MIDRLIAFSIKNKLIIGIFTIALIGWGVYSFKQIPIDAVPDITNNQVQIITQAPTLAAQEVEQFITFPIEIAMANIPDVVEIRSISRFGLSVITVVFEENKDIYLARQLISEQLKTAEEQIPEGFGKPGLAPITTGLGEIYQYVLYTEPGYDTVYSAMDLRTINDWIVRRQLAGTPGIIEVNGWGGYLKQYEIAVNPEKLRSMNITIAEILEAAEKNNENTGGSYIEKRYNTYFIRGEGLIKSLEDIEKIVIKTVRNTPILIRDVAKVQYGSAPRYGAVTRNARGEVVGGQALMLKGENSYQVVQAVKKRLETIKKSLPEGIVLEPYEDRSELIDRAMNTVTKNLIEGGLIVIFILILLLGNFRAGMIVASVIPLSMLFALGMMNIFGVSANLMSLGALDFGLIVDGAVIIVESIVFHLQSEFKNKHLSHSEIDEQVRLSATKIRKSAAFGEIIILIVYLPILALVGIEGKMFKPMAQTVSFAIFGALILSLTYVPMMAALALNKKIKIKVTIADKIINRLQRWYNPVINYALNNKAKTIIVAVLLFAMSLFTFSRLGGEFIPTLEEGNFALHQILPPGSSLAQSIEISGKLQKILLEKFPEVEQVVTKMGSAEIPTDPMPLEVGDIMVKMKPKSEWTSASTKDEMFEKMEKELSVIPGVSFEFTQPIQMRFNELMTGVRQDIAIKIYGEDLNVLYIKAKKAESIIKGIRGIGDTKVEQITGLPQIIINYNRSKIAQYGLNIKDLNKLIRTAFAGEKAGVVFENERRFDLVVRLQKDYRQNIDDIKNLYITLPNGSQVPLKEVAKIEFKEGPMQISRDDTKRRITIGINARNRDVESLVEEIQQKLDEQLDLPPGYYTKYGGQFENLVAAKKRLSVAVPIALALIFILLFFTFNSVKQALMVYTAIPLATIGGVYSLWLRDMPFSISAGVGFIALFGVAVLNGIVLISYFNQLKKEGVTDMKERILKGTKVRLRPVIMTASVAAFGFLPMALSQSAGAEVQRPLATVVIGGLITATFLTLVVLPILYSIFDEMKFSWKSKPAATIILLMITGSLFATSKINAQNVNSERSRTTDSLTLEQAVETALKNHPTVKAANLEVEKQQKLKKTSLDIDKTNISYTQGQLNSAFIDNRLSISQDFKFPTTYISQANLQKRKVALSENALSITQNELVRNVRAAYMQLSYGYTRQKLLNTLENTYANFLKAAEKRYQTGETNLLEKIAAQGKYQEIKLMKQQADADVKIYMQELQKWLNTNNPVTISETNLNKLELPLSEAEGQDTGLPAETLVKAGNVNNNPLLQYYQQSIRVSEQQYKLEKSGYLPDLSAGYFNQQIDGTPGFTGFQVGVKIPLWYRTQQGKVQAAKIDAEIAQAEYENYNLMIKTLFAGKLQEYYKYKGLVDYYESQGLAIAGQLIKFAEKSYKAGEIDYVEYIRNIDQAIDIKTKYLDNLNQFNQTVIDLQFLLGQYN